MALMTRIAELDAFARLHPDLWLDVNARDEDEVRPLHEHDRLLVERVECCGAASDEPWLAA